MTTQLPVRNRTNLLIATSQALYEIWNMCNMLYSLLHTRKKKPVLVGLLVPPKRIARHSISLIARGYYCYENNTKN